MQAAQQIIRPSPLPETTNYVVHNSGPFYAYAPGEPIHRVDARDSVPHLWAGLIVPVTDFPQLVSTELSGPYSAGSSPDGKRTINRVWASHIVDIIHRPYFPRAMQIVALDRKPLVTVGDDFSVRDNLLAEFNRMICPYPIGFEEWDLPPEARKVKPPKEVLEFVAEFGVGAYRDKCLGDAESLCGESEMGYALRSAIGQMREAIKRYRDYATAYIDFEEREIEKQGKLQEGKAVYDSYDRRLLQWLGRKEKQIQSPQIVVPQMPAQAITMGPEFGAAIGSAMAEQLTPLWNEINQMKAKQGTRRPSLTRRKQVDKPEPVSEPSEAE